MSKGKLLKAKSSGSLGDITMYLRLGVPVQRARNRNPRNPRTQKQQDNRRRMAIVLQEWHRVKAENIPLNFDGRKSNQSIYSAFIALNLPLVNIEHPELTQFQYSLA